MGDSETVAKVCKAQHSRVGEAVSSSAWRLRQAATAPPPSTDESIHESLATVSAYDVDSPGQPGTGPARWMPAGLRHLFCCWRSGEQAPHPPPLPSRPRCTSCGGESRVDPAADAVRAGDMRLLHMHACALSLLYTDLTPPPQAHGDLDLFPSRDACAQAHRSLYWQPGHRPRATPPEPPPTHPIAGWKYFTHWTTRQSTPGRTRCRGSSRCSPRLEHTAWI